ncbi:MAG: hypothetical protein JRG83_06850, partial [Deltaproteobacteria bacterium]|nr:hypothetical protein [Deltaproteobacteria bacterium]
MSQSEEPVEEAATAAAAEAPTEEAAPERWPLAAPLVKRTLVQSFVLAQLAGIVTLLCINALTRGGASAEGWELGLLALVGVTHLVGVLLLHAGFFRDILALDPQRERPEPDLAVVERAFGRVVNAPRYWFLRANFWFVIAAFNLSLARHWVDPDAFPWIHVI